MFSAYYKERIKRELEAAEAASKAGDTVKENHHLNEAKRLSGGLMKAAQAKLAENKNNEGNV